MHVPALCPETWAAPAKERCDHVEVVRRMRILGIHEMVGAASAQSISRAGWVPKEGWYSWYASNDTAGVLELNTRLSSPSTETSISDLLFTLPRKWASCQLFPTLPRSKQSCTLLPNLGCGWAQKTPRSSLVAEDIGKALCKK